MNAEQIQNKVFLLFVSKQPLIDWLPPPLLDNGQHLVGVNVWQKPKALGFVSRKMIFRASDAKYNQDQSKSLSFFA